MLGKLCKYEFKSMLRTLLPIYIAFMSFSVLVGIVLSFQKHFFDRGFDYYTVSMDMGYQIYDTITTIIAFVYAIMFISICVVTVVLIVQRFYKGLLCDEGYLMFTLPVKTWELVFSKAFVASIVFLLSSWVSFLSVFIAGLIEGGKDKFNDILMVIREFQEKSEIYGISFAWFWIWIILVFVAGFFMTISFFNQTYVSMAIGHLAKKHRVFASVAAFIGIAIFLTIASSIAFFTLSLSFIESEEFLRVAVPWIVAQIENRIDVFSVIFKIYSVFTAIYIVYNIIKSVIFFFITERILAKKLNLE